MSVGASDVSSLVTFLSLDNIENNFFAVAHRSEEFFRVVLDDGSLMNENVLIGIVSMNEAIAVANVEPLDLAGYARAQDDSVLNVDFFFLLDSWFDLLLEGCVTSFRLFDVAHLSKKRCLDRLK